MVNGDKNDSYDISLNENGGYVFGQSAGPIEMNGDKIVIDSGNLSGEYCYGGDLIKLKTGARLTSLAPVFYECFMSAFIDYYFT